jgi:hypothetical protein
MSSYGRWIAVAATAFAATYSASAGVNKPAGGICECGTYSEAPTICAPLIGTKRAACIVTNMRWFDKCTAWRNKVCRAPGTPAESASTSNARLPLGAPVAETPAPPQASPTVATAPASPAPAAPQRQVSMIVPPAVAKFGGSWAGMATCRMATEKWRLTMNVSLLADGTLLATATSGETYGSFRKVEIKDDDVILHYDTFLSERVYTGHLVQPNRIEGQVDAAGQNCTWYLTRSS